MYYVGVVGHRYFASNEAVSFIETQFRTILNAAFVSHHRVAALSALAAGADTIFAETAVSLGAFLRIIIPFENYIIDFVKDRERQRYLRLRYLANDEIKLAYPARSEAAYAAAMNYIVSNSDLLVAVWDGTIANGAGGTEAAIEHAVSIGCPWIHLDVTNLSVRYCDNTSSPEEPLLNTGLTLSSL